MGEEESGVGTGSRNSASPQQQPPFNSQITPKYNELALTLVAAVKSLMVYSNEAAHGEGAGSDECE